MTTKLATGWYITTGRLEQGGRVHRTYDVDLGPFVSRDLALTVRSYVERVEGRTDLWVQEVTEDGPQW